MIQAANFRLVQAQAAVFTPGLQFRAARVLPRLLTDLTDLFDAEPQILDIPVMAAEAAAIPRIMLKSTDGRWALQAGPARLDVFRRAVGGEPMRLEDLLDRALPIFDLYEGVAPNAA